MHQTEPQVTTQRGYQLPAPADAERRERDVAARGGPYERRYELRRGYELPAASIRRRTEPAQ
ncbi:MAG TPA: hypothetical protein VGR27_13960 [Longimicrobiaceae bacterium]|nr:hypothetical protein [Longimicrobiaceae bacterium]